MDRSMIRYKLSQVMVLTGSLFLFADVNAERGGGFHGGGGVGGYHGGNGYYHQGHGAYYHGNNADVYHGNNVDVYHGNNGDNVGVYHGNNEVGVYHGNNYYGDSGAIVNVPVQGYYGPTYVCPTVQQCFPNGTCVENQVCDQEDVW